MWPAWHEQASCLGMNDAVFFGSSSPDDRPAYTLSQIRVAKAICASCPVFESCLRQAIRNREAYGVWAATTMKERHRIFILLATKTVTEDQVVQALLRQREVANGH